jgi:hypothetical protein
MTDEPADPFRPPIDFQFAAALREGKVYVEQLRGCGHYSEALRTISALDERQLAGLALYLAAEARIVEMDQSGDGNVWGKWWRGVDTPGEENPTAMDTTPGMLMKIMRPPEED